MSDTLKDELLAIWDSECVSGKLWQSLRARLARATVTEPPEPPAPDPCVVQPTDAERLDALRRELGSEWVVSELGSGGDYYVRHQVYPSHQIARRALRAPDGIRKTADALRWLAQSGEGE